MEAEVQATDFEQFKHKNRLQEFAQKSGIPMPVYRTVNEGTAHIPQFRATVVVDGTAYTSPRTFLRRKAAEQDAAKLAFETILRRIEDEGFSLTQEDMMFCKSILHEYAVKMNLKGPTYTTSQAAGTLRMFTSSVVFDGQAYNGVPAKSKKEAEQMAAIAAIECIIASSNNRTIMGEIVRSKRKLRDVVSGGSSLSGTKRSVASQVHTQTNPNEYDTVNNKEVLADSVPESISKVIVTETFTPKAKKSKEACACELSYGINRSGSSQPTHPQGESLAAVTGGTISSEGSLAHDKANDEVKQVHSSTVPVRSPTVVITSGMKQSDTTQNKLPESISKPTVTEPYTSEAKKCDEACACELSYGVKGNGSSQTAHPQGEFLAAMRSGTTSFDGSLAHDKSNDEVKQMDSSTVPADSLAVALSSGRKRSDALQNEGHESKKARTIGQCVDST